ncbi:hypothetical protein J7I44_04465 [Frateuria sp. MAH-13]|uniref:DUF4178 domain-containing protein n=1 Tax=Frateuria flava TaxID=2821489 RepID=A0ABS4DKG1_9GAMM|nr:hypothetical protein [Frateuria flava]MBP1473540.1 hypothetical protein [Frateuria flava]
MQRLLWLGLVVLLGWGALGWWQQRPLHPPPGVLAAQAPEQVDLDEGAVLQRGDTVLRTRAHIALTARVLSREDYRWDAGASLAPTDLALGWGRMSDTAVLADIDIRQSSRFFYWHVRDYPIPRHEIETSATNMHLIPADDGVRYAIKHVRPGELVHLEGFLVDASRPDGWHWRTSLRRDDTGNGACELVYVEELAPVAP